MSQETVPLLSEKFIITDIGSRGPVKRYAPLNEINQPHLRVIAAKLDGDIKRMETIVANQILERPAQEHTLGQIDAQGRLPRAGGIALATIGL